MLYLKHSHFLIFSKFASPFGRVRPTDRSGGALLAKKIYGDVPARQITLAGRRWRKKYMGM